MYLKDFCKVFIFCLLAHLQVHAQETEDEWNVPLSYVGDSLDLVENQKVILTGKVTNGATGEPVSGASVSVNFFKHYDYTDNKGSFAIELLPGIYKVKIKHVGMLPVYLRLQVFSAGALDIKMDEGVVALTEVVISSRPLDSNVKESFGGLTKLNIQEIKTLPTLMGEVDILKSLQLMPGVTSVGEGSSGLNVRGGRVDQNLVLLNDVPLFNTAHALGFVSAFNQDIVDNFSLYKGNVPANHGGRASSVLEINTRRGDFQKWKFQGGVGPISSRIMTEGPITPNTSVLLAGRISHAGWFIEKIKDPDVRNSSVKFYDAYTGITHRFSENSKLDLITYASRDEFQFSDQFGYDWSTHIVSAKWQSMANRKASPILTVSYGNFKTSLFDPSGMDASKVSNTMNYFQIKEALHFIPNDSHTIITGLSAIAYVPKDEQRSTYAGNKAINEKHVDKSAGAEFALFFNDDFQISEKFSVSAGLRYSGYLHMGSDTVFHYAQGATKSVASITDTTLYARGKQIKSFTGLEPRISARFSLTNNQSIKLSYNRMRQYIHMISNTTAPTPIDFWQVSTEFLPPQIADNYSFGYFLNIKDNRWETSAEFFAKVMDNLVEYKDFPSLFLNPHLETELVTGKGKAYGGELYIRRLKGKWTGWASYTYSQTKIKVASPISTENINNGNWFPSNYNKPHNFNLIINRSLRKSSAFSFTFSYATGRPFTAIESSYIVNGTVVPVFSDRNKYKIPNYIRFDFSFTIGNIIKKLDDNLVFSIYNLVGRDNAYSVFYKRPAANFFVPKAYKLSVLGSALPSLTYNFKF
jgi:hypothetical protein